MFEKNLEEIFSNAVNSVRVYGHEMLTVEHIFLSLLQHPEGRNALHFLDVNVEKAEYLLEHFLLKQVEHVAIENIENIIHTQSVQRVLTRVAQYVNNAGNKKARCAELIMAVLEEKQSYVYAVLVSLGLNHEALKTMLHNTEEADTTSLLSKITISLSSEAKAGKIDAIVGREKEIDKILQILARRKKNNPILIGDPGVGKTTILEGLALRIEKGDVPPQCKNMQLYVLEIGNLLAGTKYRGDFEAKMQELLKELQSIPNAVLVIDEIHSIVGAGATSGSSIDAASLLKPILAKGIIRCIGSTTYDEYQAHIEKDKALSRRFQKVFVDEPDEKTTIDIIKGIIPLYEKFHSVRYTHSAIALAVSLSIKYMTERHLPDKAIDILDEAGAFMRLHSTKAMCTIGAKEIENIVASMVQVPIHTIEQSETVRLKTLKKELEKTIIGQSDAVEAISKSIIRSYVGLVDGTRPIGSFLFYGPTGVGKTELAKQLAKHLAIDFHRFDMSEYMEQHSVARLIGSPPGYVGFEQSGLLTDTIRKSPYSVLLLDEIEKAHPDVFNILLQVMDYGSLTDNKGRKADFSNSIIIMTSNVGVEDMKKNSIGFDSMHALDISKTTKALERTFTPEFRNRLDAMIPFMPLSDASIEQIVRIAIENAKVLLKQHKVRMKLTDNALHFIASQGFDKTLGARPLQHFIRSSLYDLLAEGLLYKTIQKGDSIIVDANTKGLLLKQMEPA